MIKRQIETIKEGVKLVGVSLAIAVAAVFIVLFFSQKIKSEVRTISEKRNEFTVFSKRQDAANQLKANGANAAERIAKLETLLPTWDNAMTVVNYLNTAGAQSNNVVSIRVGSTPNFNQESSIGTVDFSADIGGTLVTFSEFLKKIEKAPYLITIKSVSTAFTDSQNSQLTAKIAGIIYLRKD